MVEVPTMTAADAFKLVLLALNTFWVTAGVVGERGLVANCY